MNTSTPAIYNIIPLDGHWRMVVGDREFGRFISESHAIRVAIETAHKAGRANMWGAQVILHGTNRSSEIIWTYGRDPFPPTSFS